ncbi:MAG TPA: cupin domain-containing protein [Gemmatimonadota bacterium]|nr:cupin domain-containing protein [Gemmatimonadota bacterium]
MTDAAELIRVLGLEPLPVEGGHFRETWRSDHTVPRTALPARYQGERCCGTAILYLLTSDPDSFSALHRLPTDEIYHFYLGDPVELLLLFPGGEVEVATLGPDVLGGHRVQQVVPRGVWQGSRVKEGGAWSLLGTTMAPGFEVADYEPGDRDRLVAAYPTAGDRIRSLTRRPFPGPEA